ncbi:MAG: kinase/pyrophosphorylase [Nitrospirota bacterium]|nr:kinase/pyrophosphorylase [Nitrospirota bacterium]
MSDDRRYYLYIISDGTGETAERVVRAALLQFRHRNVALKRIPNIRTEEQMAQVLGEAAEKKAMVAYTIVSSERREIFIHEAERLAIPTVDVIGPTMFTLSEFFETSPEEKPGLFPEIDEDYFSRIDAMNFAVKHDDGQGLRGLGKADIVIVGPSRTSKTPTSVYLAQKGWWVANVPLVKELDPPIELFELDQSRIVALMIDAERLSRYRASRIAQMKSPQASSYAELCNVAQEIEWARDLYRKNPQWYVIDISGKAVEEVAGEIVTVMNRRGIR